jgi:hypothetical protein
LDSESRSDAVQQDKEEDEHEQPIIFKRVQESSKFEGKFKYKARRSYKFDYKYREVDTS